MSPDHAGVAPSCSNHPGVETRLQCSNCGSPICPRCMVSSSVGQKCPDCARQTGRARGVPTAGVVARVVGATLAASAATALLLGPVLGRFGLLFSVLYGLLVGTVGRWAARGRAHTLLGVAAAAGLVIGLTAVTVVQGGNPLTPGILIAALIAGGIAFVRGAGIW